MVALSLFACAHSADEPYPADLPRTEALEDASPAPTSSSSGGSSGSSGSPDTPDAGGRDATTNDSGGPQSDAGSPQDSAPPPDAAPPPPDASGTVTTACDTSNTFKVILYQAELASTPNPQTCPCNPGQCCFGFFCVAK